MSIFEKLICSSWINSLIFIALLIEGFVISPSLIAKYERHKFYTAHWPNHPSHLAEITNTSEFPVLVLKSGKNKDDYRATVIPYYDLKSYMAENPDYTFLIPPRKENDINQQLAKQQKAHNETGPMRVEVKRLSDGRQKLRVFYSYYSDKRGTVTNCSWYIAENKKFDPVDCGTFGKGIIIFCTIFMLIPVNIIIYAVILFLIDRKRKQLSDRNAVQ